MDTEQSSPSEFEDDDLEEFSQPTSSPLESERVAKLLDIPFIAKLDSFVPPKELIRGEFSRVIGSWGKQWKAIPIAEDDTSVTVAVGDPLRTEVIDALRLCYGKYVKLVVAPEAEIIRAINSVRTSLMSDRSSALDSDPRSDDPEASNTLKIDVTDAEDDDAPIIRYVNTLIFRAASQRASDIHIEPFEEVLKVRYRVDGVLHDVDTESKVFQAPILSRVKVMANLNIAEKRLPQDGRIGLRIAGQDVDIRVSTVPTRYGERIVMRLLDKSKQRLEIPSIGFHPDIDEVVRRLIVKSHGIVLVTGPTGSGKTTTLYACLSHINSADKNILTIEDPVEYELGGVGQMQVSPKIDFTFASGLRSILRQDPDVIMVGEIRDLETVEIAIQASLTGHLVFSTLHTNDAPGAITRLLDMGVEPFLISSSVLAVIGQRLIRTLCHDCKVQGELSEVHCRELGLDVSKYRSSPIFGPSENGCPLCQGTGYLGRMGIHELMMIDDTVRSQIMDRANSTQLRASSNSLKSLRWDGAIKLLDGVTSFEEILRVTQEDAVG